MSLIDLANEKIKEKHWIGLMNVKTQTEEKISDERTEKMAQSVKCLPCKDLTLIPQNPLRLIGPQL